METTMKECEFCLGENHQPGEKLLFIAYRNIDNETRDGDACADCIDTIWFDNDLTVTKYEVWK